MTPRFLLVEDDKYLQDMVQLKAQAEKITIIAAPSAQAAKQELAVGSYHLAALDIMLPDHSGVEVAIHILKNHPGVQFIFISAMNRAVFLEKYAAQIAEHPPLAAAPYLMKPFSLDYFFSIIKKTVASRDQKPGKVKRVE